MATLGRQYKKKESHSREKQTTILKSRLEPMGQPSAAEDTTEEVLSEVTVLPERDDYSAKKSRGIMLVEQKLTYSYGLKKPVLYARIRLTTAVRGKREIDGLQENAYLLRLELVEASPDLKVEGFQLGPWNAESLNMEQGAIFVCEPLWSGFQPVTMNVRGRFLFRDMARKKILDMPWKTEAVVPGSEPF